MRRRSTICWLRDIVIDGSPGWNGESLPYYYMPKADIHHRERRERGEHTVTVGAWRRAAGVIVAVSLDQAN